MSNNNNHYVDVDVSEDDCKEALRRLKDGILPQADYVDILQIGETYQLRVRRIFQPSLAPKFICRIHKLTSGVRISIQHLRGNTLVFQTYLSILLAGTFIVCYGFLHTGANSIALIITLCITMAILIGLFIRENRLISHIREEILTKIAEAIEFNRSFDQEKQIVKNARGNRNR